MRVQTEAVYHRQGNMLLFRTIALPCRVKFLHLWNFMLLIILLRTFTSLSLLLSSPKKMPHILKLSSTLSHVGNLVMSKSPVSGQHILFYLF